MEPYDFMTDTGTWFLYKVDSNDKDLLRNAVSRKYTVSA